MRSYANTTNVTFLTIFVFFSLLFIFILSHRFIPQSNMQNSPSLPMDPYEHLNIVANHDGSIMRLPMANPIVPPGSSALYQSKDVQINPLNYTSVRLYLPRVPLNARKPDGSGNLPIVVFVHGGGFILCSTGTPVVHEFCSTAASHLNALIVSVDYRLAPEHRLPTAYDDVLEALTWVRDSKDEWVTQYGDLSRCVLMGESAGGNIVYHVGLKASGRVDELKPLNIRGLVLIQPYFGGVDLVRSELLLANDSVLPMNVNELMWNLSLPVGKDRSHEYCDPSVGGGSKSIEVIRDLEWRVGVVASGGDPLFDRDVELARLLEHKGLNVKCLITKDDQHGVFVSDSTNKRKDLLDFVMDFLS